MKYAGKIEQLGEGRPLCWLVRMHKCSRKAARVAHLQHIAAALLQILNLVTDGICTGHQEGLAGDWMAGDG